MNTDNIGVVFIDPEMDKSLMLEAIHGANDEDKVIVIGNNAPSMIDPLMAKEALQLANILQEIEPATRQRGISINNYVHLDSPKPPAQGSLKLGSYKFKSNRNK